MGADESIGVGRVSDNQHLHKRSQRIGKKIFCKDGRKKRPTSKTTRISMTLALLKSWWACMFLKTACFAFLSFFLKNLTIIKDLQDMTVN